MFDPENKYKDLFNKMLAGGNAGVFIDCVSSAFRKFGSKWTFNNYGRYEWKPEIREAHCVTEAKIVSSLAAFEEVRYYKQINNSEFILHNTKGFYETDLDTISQTMYGSDRETTQGSAYVVVPAAKQLTYAVHAGAWVVGFTSRPLKPTMSFTTILLVLIFQTLNSNPLSSLSLRVRCPTILLGSLSCLMNLMDLGIRMSRISTMLGRDSLSNSLIKSIR
jgi:hypothetical protein